MVLAVTKCCLKRKKTDNPNEGWEEDRWSPPARAGSWQVLFKKERKKERKQTTQGRDGRTVHRHHTGIFLRRGGCGASRRPPLGVCLFLSLFAVCRRFSLQPSCHPAVFLLSSFSLPSLREGVEDAECRAL